MPDGGLVRVGDIPLFAEIAEETKPFTRAQEKLIDTSVHIRQNPATVNDAVWQHAVFCQVGLPRKKTKELKFERRSGDVSILVTAGDLQKRRRWVQMPLPYGPKPRLILMYAITQALKTNSPVVHIGKSAAEFMEKLGIRPQGSEYRSLDRQLQALAACEIKLGVAFDGVERTQKVQTFDRIDLFRSHNPNQQTLWTREIEFAAKFYASMREHAVPLRDEAVAGLRGSALALDVYPWLAHRLYRVRGKYPIRWQALKSQFGGEYAVGVSGMDSFKQEFKATLKDVLKLYPEARVEVTREGLNLYPSPPPIPPKLMITVPALPGSKELGDSKDLGV